MKNCLHEFSIKNDWRSDASERYVDMTWGGDNIDKNSNDDDINYLKLLSLVAIHYQTIFNSYLNDWYPKFVLNPDKLILPDSTLFTLNTKSLASVVPIKFVRAEVPELPVKPQAFALNNIGIET